MNHKLVNVAFNLPINSLFTYYLPEAYQDKVRTGMRVFAPFGRRNLTGVVLELPVDKGLTKDIKPIFKILDDIPILSREMLDFCLWMSEYYACPVGEVIFSAVPKGISIESKIIYSPEERAFKGNGSLTNLQRQILDILNRKSLTIKQIESKLKEGSAAGAIKALMKQNLIRQEYLTVEAKTKPKFEKFIIFEHLDNFKQYSDSMLENFFKENKVRSELQVFALKYFIERNIDEIKLSELIKEAGIHTSAVNSLVRKGLLTIDKRQVLRQAQDDFGKDEKIVELNTGQQTILKTIAGALQSGEFKTFLLFGVTGSGKTQVYLEAIKETLASGKTAVVLVPEISLTPQLIYRFKNFFGDTIGVMHSKLSEGERFDVYHRVKSKDVKIIVRARSAIFAPLEDIGIIIVDEEHDQSYKQAEKNPK